MDHLPPFVVAERDALVREIETAFDGVSREGGVSWAEAEIADAYGDYRGAEHRQKVDQDSRWQDLLTDGVDFPGNGIGVWPFLDAVGFRYHLPAAMTLSVRSGNDETVCFPLTLPKGDPFFEDRWTLLNLRQRRCVKRFLQYMNVTEACRWARMAGWGDSIWLRALERYWNNIPDEPNVPQS